MTTLDTTDDLLRAARENPEFREAFRRLILTEDLLELPDRVGEYSRATDKKIESLTDNVNTLARTVGTLADSISEYKTTTDKNLKEMNNNISGIRQSHREEHNALDRFRGNYAIEAARNSDAEIAEQFAGAHGVRRFRLRTLTRDEREDLFDDNLDIIDRLDTEGNVSRGFPKGDIIAEARQRRSRELLYYIAVEASYTVDAGDVIRASDNAKILRSATGVDAYAVVAGVTLDSEVEELYRQRIIYNLTQFLESEEDNVVLWFQLTDRSLQPLPPC